MSIKNVKLSDIRIFKDYDSTVGELCNPEDIGVEEMNMHLARFFISACTKSKKFYESDSLKCIQASISLYILVMANVDIHCIVSTIANYENRTVTAIFRL